MLHEFIAKYHNEIVTLCRDKVSKRASPPLTPLEREHGVPLFLGQLVDALRKEQERSDRAAGKGLYAVPPSAENNRTAALHGRELLEQGFTIGQVVHAYGDICQAVTELASEKHAGVTVQEYHTFNKLLDDAIAEAVSAYTLQHDQSAGVPSADLHARLGLLADEQRHLVDTALVAFSALKIGQIGLHGATGTVLEATLHKLRDLAEKKLPEIRTSTGMVVTRKVP